MKAQDRQAGDEERGAEVAAGEGAPLPESKRKAYLWGGAALLLLALVTSALNLVLHIPEYQKISWFLVGFFAVSGVAGVGVAKSPSPTASKAVEYGEALVVAILLAVAIRATVIQAFKIPSGSMLPTLQIGDHLLVTKLLYGPRIPYTAHRFFRVHAPRRGDIVVFAYPLDDSKDFIKRVIGEPGDVIQVIDKRVWVNGKPLADPWGRHVDPLVIPAGYGEEGKRDYFGPVKVPAGQYFVMGDNRDRSYDSRFWGFVEDGRIRGKALVLYWSWDSESGIPAWKIWDRIRWSRLGGLIR